MHAVCSSGGSLLKSAGEAWRAVREREWRAAQVKRARNWERRVCRATWECGQSRARVYAGEGNGHARASASVQSRPSPAAQRPPSHLHQPAQKLTEILEAFIEKAIFNCRFSTLLAVGGSLGGSVICFVQGCRFVSASFLEYVQLTLLGTDTGHVIVLLVEAIYIFLVATVMLIFGMGIYELFISTIGGQSAEPKIHKKYRIGSNIFGLFRIEERPLWLEIRSLHELKTKVGHVIVMILLVGMFEKSKQIPISTGFDLLCFAASILLASGCLFLLSKLNIK